MSTVFYDIHEALMAAVKAKADAIPLPVAWPDREYVPQEGTPYVRVKLFHAPTTPASGGVNGLNMHAGILELAIAISPELGSDSALQWVDSFATYIKRGTTWTSGSASVRVESVSRDLPVKDKAWTLYPINIRWRCYAGD